MIIEKKENQLIFPGKKHEGVSYEIGKVSPR